MALKDSEIHVVAAVATPVLSALLGALFILSTSSQRGCESSKDDDPAIDKYTVIEASIAMKKDKKATQPVKPPNAPPPTKHEGVSHDEQKKPKPPDKKKDEPKVDNTKPPDFSSYKHPNPDDATNKAPRTQGDFNGADNGNALVSKGDAFIGRLSADMNYVVPPIAECDGTPPLACIKLSAQGKVVETKIKQPSDKPCLTSAAEEAIKRIKQARDEKPEEVPSHLLESLTENGICFRPTVN